VREVPWTHAIAAAAALTVAVFTPRPVTAQATDIVARDAWVRESTATRTTSAGYVTIENHGTRDVTLTGVAVDGAPRVELHAMTHDQGQSTMKSVSQVREPAGGSVELAPGGLHAMIFDVTRPYERGKSVRMTLKFEGNQTKSVEAVVRPLSAVSVR